MTFIAVKKEKLYIGERSVEPIYITQEVTDLSSYRVRAVETLLRFKTSNGQVLHFSDVVNDPAQLELASDTAPIFHNAQKAIADKLFRAGYKYVGFNISTQHLLNADWLSAATSLCDHVAEIYPDHGVVFEIIETPTKQPDQEECLIGSILTLRERSAQFAIDDFGKLGSSILRLCRLQLEYVKLDRSLVDVAATSVFAKNLIGALVRECQANNVTVIAEGVETREMSEVWMQLNVNLQQGFLFDRPKTRP